MQPFICIFEWCSCRENPRVTGKTRGTGSPNTVTLNNPAHWVSFNCAHPAAPGVHSNTFQIMALVWLVHSRQTTKHKKTTVREEYSSYIKQCEENDKLVHNKRAKVG